MLASLAVQSLSLNGDSAAVSVTLKFFSFLFHNDKEVTFGSGMFQEQIKS